MSAILSPGLVLGDGNHVTSSPAPYPAHWDSFYSCRSLTARRFAVTESEIWQIIQTGNEISVMRVQVFLSITVGVLIVSTVRGIRLNMALMCIMLSAYLVFGYINFSMTMSEMSILLAGITQIHSMVEGNQEVSLMGRYLASQLESPTAVAIIPAMHISYWTVTIATIIYSIWRYLRQSPEE
jgi:hypothetical protein